MTIDRPSAEPILRTDLGALYEGDCIPLMRALPAGSVDLFFADPPFNLGKDYGAAAAVLRAKHGAALRLPDALVVATAAAQGADRVLTTDAGWPKLTVAVEVLSGGR